MEPEDELKAANELLRLKLELEHDIKMEGQEGLSPQAENQWLQYVYNFEKHLKEARRIKVYDFIGRPPFVPMESLSDDKANGELKKIEAILREKGIALDVCCEYDAALIYRFITEELFQHEMDDTVLEGMVRHFSYEEFHPNHDYDIRRLVTDFIKSILTGKWDERFDSMALGETVCINGKDYDASQTSAIIISFQEVHTSFKLENFSIEKVNLDDEAERGIVIADLAYFANPTHESPYRATGDCLFEVAMEYGYWCITKFKIPGLST